MGLLDFFSKKKTPEKDIIKDLTLSKMKKGFMVDYDMKTWEVTAYNIYDWGKGDRSHEWQLNSHDDMIFLELEEDDGQVWTVSRKIDYGRLDPNIRSHILDTGDPPSEIQFEGVTYYMEEMAGGHFYRDGSGEGQEMLRWSYENDAGTAYLEIEQWGEQEFEAGTGIPAESYQFTNILPAP